MQPSGAGAVLEGDREEWLPGAAVGEVHHHRRRVRDQDDMTEHAGRRESGAEALRDRTPSWCSLDVSHSCNRHQPHAFPAIPTSCSTALTHHQSIDVAAFRRKTQDMWYTLDANLWQDHGDVSSTISSLSGLVRASLVTLQHRACSLAGEHRRGKAASQMVTPRVAPGPAAA